MKKRFISTLLCFTLVFSFAGCGKSEEKTSTATSAENNEDENYVYNISACMQDSNMYDEQLVHGFSDALNDYLGEEHVQINIYGVSEEHTTDSIANAVVKNKVDMIFTTGKQMLVSATTATETIPIIATGVVDFESTLRIAPNGNKSWDKKTGINVTGVSSKPSIASQLSLLIEATEDLQTVGLLYSPEDLEAVYQNEILEKYLDQAGIPWKEYSIPATDHAIIEEEDQNSQTLLPNKFVAPNAKTGMDNTVVSFGEDLIVGLNSPSSTRTALASANWTGGKVIPKDEDEDSEETSDDSDVTKKDDSEEEAPSLEELISLACEECSAIYIPFGSMLTDQMETIGNITTAAGVITVAGDTTIGQNALVTLFYDPYDLGYMAGKKAVKVLQGGDITTIKISSADSDNCVKLYNATVAEAFEMTFPKSFSEINEFLETYEFGSNTTRYVGEED